MLHTTIFWALALFFCICHAEPQAMLVQNNNKGEQVVKMEAGETFKPGDKSVKTKMFPNSDFESEFYCKESLGKQLTATADGRYVGCCLPDQILVGSEDTQFMCCGKGHIMAGSKEVGFSCCPEGQSFDGKLCQAVPTCDNGKEMVGGKCVCPKGQSETSDGTCQKPQEHCKSDISYGKCYMFQFHNGEFFGADNGGTYYAYPADIYHGNGVFTFCQDEKCESKGPIGANDSFYIRDNRGTPPSGVNPGWFLGNDQNGGHVYKRNNVASYGEFTIAKFPDCNKYCLGGKKYGVYYACPSTTPAITFWTNDPKVCIPIELVEVQCDFHEDKSNCAWQGGCNKNKLSGPPTPPHMDL